MPHLGAFAGHISGISGHLAECPPPPVPCSYCIEGSVATPARLRITIYGWSGCHKVNGIVNTVLGIHATPPCPAQFVPDTHYYNYEWNDGMPWTTPAALNACSRQVTRLQYLAGDINGTFDLYQLANVPDPIIADSQTLTGAVIDNLSSAGIAATSDPACFWYAYTTRVDTVLYDTGTVADIPPYGGGDPAACRKVVHANRELILAFPYGPDPTKMLVKVYCVPACIHPLPAGTEGTLEFSSWFFSGFIPGGGATIQPAVLAEYLLDRSPADQCFSFSAGTPALTACLTGSQTYGPLTTPGDTVTWLACCGSDDGDTFADTLDDAGQMGYGGGCGLIGVA